jgi:hypothetical protein
MTTFFLTRSVGKADFFSESGNGIRAYLSNEALPVESGKMSLSGHNDALNAQQWMMNEIGVSSIDRIQEHYPKGVIKSLMTELESHHPDIFEEVRAEKFRQITGHSVLANIYPDWCISTGRGDIRINECEYLYTHDIEETDLKEELQSMIGQKLCLCINDTTDNRNDVISMQEKLDEHLSHMFPKQSPYEIKHKYHATLNLATNETMNM